MIYDEKHVSFDTVNVLLKSNEEQMYARQIGYNVEAYECDSNDNEIISKSMMGNMFCLIP